MAVLSAVTYYDNLGASLGGTVYVDEDKDVRDWGTLNRSGTPSVITGSSLADLATRSAAALNTGTLSDARLSANVALRNQANTFTADISLEGTTTTGWVLMEASPVLQMEPRTTTPNTAAGQVRIFAFVDSGGAQSLRVRFANGTTKTIATDV